MWPRTARGAPGFTGKPPAPCPARRTRRAGSETPPGAFSAGTQGGTGRGWAPALRDRLPPALRARQWACQRRGRGVASPRLVIQQLPPSRPPPPRPPEMFISPSEPLSSFTFLFSGGWDSLVSAPGEAQLTRSLPPPALPARPALCSPDSMEVQSSASRLWERRRWCCKRR